MDKLVICLRFGFPHTPRTPSHHLHKNIQPYNHTARNSQWDGSQLMLKYALGQLSFYYYVNCSKTTSFEVNIPKAVIRAKYITQNLLRIKISKAVLEKIYYYQTFTRVMLKNHSFKNTVTFTQDISNPFWEGEQEDTNSIKSEVAAGGVSHFFLMFILFQNGPAHVRRVHYLSHRGTAKAQASLCIHAFLLEPLLFTQTI